MEKGDFKSGDKIDLSCYHNGCNGFHITAVLGEKDAIYPGFARNRRVGRVTWLPDARLTLFVLDSPVTCPRCHARFVDAIIIRQVVEGRDKIEIIGYEAEGC